MQVRTITCIQMSGEYPDFCHRLVMPDYGMPLIATVLSEAGYDVKTYMEHVQAPEWSRIAESDLVCFSTLSAGADKTRTHASYYPESCLEFSDYVVFGEGDETILALVDALVRGRDVAEVPGIAYRRGDRVLRTAARPGPERFDTVPDFSLIGGYRAGAVQSRHHRVAARPPAVTRRRRS